MHSLRCELFSAIFLLCSSISGGQNNEQYQCISTNQPQTRTFSTLLEYQSNTKSFKYGEPGYAGSWVDFSFKTLDKIPKNAFVTKDSEDIWKITLANKGIEEIDDGAFVLLRCLHVLDLKNNSIKSLSPNTFDGLDNLEDLDLSYNDLVEIRDAVLKNLQNLKIINLAHNGIEQLGVQAFENLNNLETLILSYNSLRIVHPEIFLPLGKLINLYLDSNRLSDIQPETWKNLTALQDLNLANNSLMSFDPTYSFSFASLKVLNLSSNSLTQLNVFSLKKHLPFLTTIDLNGNPWPCDNLAPVLKVLKDSRIFYAGKNDSSPNEEGISCYTKEMITSTTEIKQIESTTSAPVNSVEPSGNNTNEQPQSRENIVLQSDILQAISKTQNLVIFLMFLILIFMIVDITLRLGLFKKILSNRKDTYGESTNSENIALIRN